MDPVTQGALGAAATLAGLQKRSPLSTGALATMGWVGGMAADLDILIRSADDPLLAIEYHRHFTHALAFIPLGGLFAALPWLFFNRWRTHYRWVIAATTLGYATHALLDACTTYGTLLFWPFSDYRVSWRFVSVIDPVVTLPLLAGVVLAIRTHKRRWSELAVGWVLM
ncbi:MAG: metal-dependent hydrolase, partial [Myxococcota bacterium]